MNTAVPPAMAQPREKTVEISQPLIVQEALFAQKHFLAGQRFGRLTAVEMMGGGRWRCTCDCGSTAIKKGGDLAAGRCASCGCSQRGAKERNAQAVIESRKTRAMLTAEQVRHWLDYEPESGLFTWRASPRFSVAAGSPAGCLNDRGYLMIGMNRISYAAHTLAWLYVHGRMPAGEIDHINGVRTDNRIKNLRDVPQVVNTQNRRLPFKSNTTGFLGVTHAKSARNPFKAQITIDGKPTYIGVFPTAEEAHEAYLLRKRAVHAGCTL